MARPYPLPASSQIVAGLPVQGCRYHGFSLLETSGAATAHIRLRKGSASGPVIDTILVQAGLDKGAWYGDEGLVIDDAVYVERVDGELEGSLYFG